MTGGLTGVMNETDMSRNTRYEMRDFVYRHPDLCVECFECDGTGNFFFENRTVDCWQCHGIGKVAYSPLVVRYILKLGA